MNRPRPGLDLFFVSGLILFLELALIRWLPAHVLYLSFFTNTVLLASFVGMSVGCLLARKPGRELLKTPLWLAATLGLGGLVELFRHKLEHYTNVGNQSQPDVVYFGTEVSAVTTPSFTIPVELIAGTFFFLAAACLVGPGQELGRAFARIPSRARAYTIDLCGSLTGIVLFAVGSAFELPPVAWFAIIAGAMAYLLYRPPVDAEPRPTGWVTVALLIGCVVVTVKTSGFIPIGKQEVHFTWSPYYRIDFLPRERSIATNQIGHQRMIPLDVPTMAAIYDVPHLLQKASGHEPFKRVLIIGAGSGNDLSRAVAWCAPDAKIDAVEIDPAIQRIGKAHHPNQPYSDPRVTVHLNDGRNFLRTAPANTYDLVVFALVDSLVLHSGYSNIRLESFLFTTESFSDVARVLKPDGLAVLYNYYRQGWIVGRIRDGLKLAFGGTEPIVISTPNIVDANDNVVVPLDQFLTDEGLTHVIAGKPERIDELRAKFAANGGRYWIPGKHPLSPNLTGGFGLKPPDTPLPPLPENQNLDLRKHPDWYPLRPATVEDSTGKLLPATDDWPFLYVRTPGIPALTWRGIALTLILSGLLWLTFRDRTAAVAKIVGDRSLLLRSFFLGCGFMLIETKAVVQMALLFGSTWSVNTVVFASVLVMALLGNLYAAWVKPKRLEPYYFGLFAALAANLIVPVDSFLGMERTTQILASCSLAFAPVLFAGVVFPVSFARTPYPDRFFGANVAGALVGGLAENASMLLGFKHLLLLAVGFYLLSGLFGWRSVPTPEADRGV